MKLAKVFLLVFVFNSFLFPQTRTNLEIVYSLIEKSAAQVDSLLEGETSSIEINFSSPTGSEFLNGKVISTFSQLGYKLNTDTEQSRKLDYTITNIKTNYGDLFQDGLFGEYLTQRTISYQTIINYSEEGNLKFSKEITDNYVDTVYVDEVTSIENPSVHFTKGEVPEPPVLSNLLEPILVVGTLIVTVILLFTVRGK